MRALVTCQPASSHAGRLVPFAVEFQSQGWEVRFAAGGCLREVAQGAGLAYTPAGAEEFPWSSLYVWNEPPPDLSRSEWFFRQILLPLATAMAADLTRVVTGFQPDLIVRDSTEYGSLLVSELTGIPQISVATCADSALAGTVRKEAPLVDRLRAAYCLPADPTGMAAAGLAHLCCHPARFHGPGAEFPDTVRFVRHAGTAMATTRPGDLGLPDDRPLVVVGLGTMVPTMQPELLGAILTALADLPVTAVAGAGAATERLRADHHSTGAVIRSWIPQSELLAYADLLITHGGFMSTVEALTAGVPVVGLPVFGDGFYAAERCAALGAGECLPADRRTVTGIRDSVRRVLADPAYRAAAAGLAADNRILPEPKTIVGWAGHHLARAVGPLPNRG